MSKRYLIAMDRADIITDRLPNGWEDGRFFAVDGYVVGRPGKGEKYRCIVNRDHVSHIVVEEYE